MNKTLPKKMLSIVSGGSSYYDAAATNAYRDFRDYLGGSEDHYFNSQARAISIARFRREVRNNPYLAGLYETFPGAVGYGRVRSRTKSREFNLDKDAWWGRYARSVTTTGDSLRRMILLRHHEMLVAGELFFIKLKSGKIQMISSEYCGSTLKPENENEVNGIVYSKSGVPIAYRFGRMTASGTIDFTGGRLVPAEWVIHDFRRDRVQMGRGIPWLISSLAPARDLYEITASKTKQIKDASKITGTIESDLGGDALEKLGYNKTDSVPDEAGETDDSTDAEDRPADGVKVIELKDGTFIALDPGEKLELLKNEYNASDYKELIFILLHAISAPPGLPVELWFSGLGDVNYSGFKGLGTQWNRRRRECVEDCEEKLIDPIHDWRIEKALNEMDLAEPDEGIDPYAHKCAWTRTAVLDEEREAKTDEIRLRTGVDALVDAWEREGRDPDEELEKRRQLYIKLVTAAGKLPQLIEQYGSVEQVAAPFEFLLTGELPEFRRQQAVQISGPAQNPATEDEQ